MQNIFTSQSSNFLDEIRGVFRNQSNIYYRSFFENSSRIEKEQRSPSQMFDLALSTPLKWYKARFYNVATNQNIIFLGINKDPWILNSSVIPFVVMIDNYKFTLGNLGIPVENTIQVDE